MASKSERSDRESRLSGRVPRRAVLKSSLMGGAGLATAALIGCGDDDEAKSPSQVGPGASGTTSASQPKTPDYVTAAKQDGAPFPYNYEEPSKQPKAGGVFRMGVNWDVGTWDLNKSGGANARSIGRMTANRLVGMVVGPKLPKYTIELQPELAKSWEIPPDGLRHTFRLQAGVKFHNVPPVNGRAFTARDVKAVYERAASEGSVNKGTFAGVDISAPDDSTVVMVLKKPNPDFVPSLADRSLPIYAPEVYEGNLIDTKAIGTGPGILDEVRRGVSVSVKSNPDYWAGKPLLDGMEWRIIPDQAGAIAAMRATQLEMTLQLDTTKSGIGSLLRTNPDLQVTSDPMLVSIGTWVMNPAHPKFKDARVRQALHLALDRDRMVKVLLQGYGTVLPGFGWPFLFDKMPTGADLGPWWRYDPAEAKKLLQAAGAEQLAFEVAPNPLGLAASVPKTELFKDIMREIGVTVRLVPTDIQAYNAYYYTRKFATEPGEIVDGYTTPGSPGASGFFYENVHSKSGKNYNGFNDPQLDEWAEKQQTELNPKTRKELWRKIWDKTLADTQRLEQPGAFGTTVMQPWVRYFRFSGPYSLMHFYYEYALDFQKAWLDK